MSDLNTVARALVAEGKGILAADESAPTIKKRFDSIGVDSTEANRRAYRELLFTTPGLGEFISGVILFDETIRQQAADGTPLVEVLDRNGIVAGIKVDAGAKPLAGSPGEKVTEGLDGLRERLAEYVTLGARFTKWRAVIVIGDGLPSRYCIDANAEALARFAALSQEAGLVPIVEPEVLMDGTHTIERCFEVSETALCSVFAALSRQRVVLEQMILKPSMVLSGKECPRQADVETVALQTVRCLRRAVPAAVPGIVFLSGGQPNEVATAHLNSMNASGRPHPWQVSFSYGRALQEAPLKAWAGRTANIKRAQDALHHRARLNGAARHGTYSAAMEKELVGAA
ncbi:MAG: fructose-bisphosphate aldolase class I [Planctomycetes bacterium]|nr:fructose-bisphosphate aldolase class I [Planctomycetota bacterium]